MDLLKLSGGKVHDPANGVDGAIADIWIDRDAGKIVEPPQTDQAFETLELKGKIVMPGGVDMHCHIAGPKINTARKLNPDLFRSANNVTLPPIHEAGRRYLALGYTTAFDAAVTPLGHRHARHELADLPFLDAGFFTLVGNNHYVFDCIRRNDRAGLRAFLGWLLTRTGSYAPKIVNPGGVERWKSNRLGNVRDLDEPVDNGSLTARRIVQEVASAANELGLPHPVHIHCNNLGLPGNWQTTLETMKSLDGETAHFAHIQFHSYGGGDADEAKLCSRTRELVDHVNSHPNLSVDVGQIAFGETVSLTGDGPLGHYLAKMSGKKWFSCDTEIESGCGISPLQYRNSKFVHSLQWAIGLEWYLSVKNPWQVVMSTDHPNGGSFTAYPQIIRLLMDRGFRAELLSQVHPRTLKRSRIADIDREYSLNEVAIITRAGPARLLGLTGKGHLGAGADADITVYESDPDDNWQKMFELPWLVIKSGRVLVRDSEPADFGNGLASASASGRLLEARPNYDRGNDSRIESWFDQHYSLPVASVFDGIFEA